MTKPYQEKTALLMHTYVESQTSRMFCVHCSIERNGRHLKPSICSISPNPVHSPAMAGFPTEVIVSALQALPSLGSEPPHQDLESDAPPGSGLPRGTADMASGNSSSLPAPVTGEALDAAADGAASSSSSGGDACAAVLRQPCRGHP